MAESKPKLLPPGELEAARRDLQAAEVTVAKLPDGLVKKRMLTALEGVNSEIQEHLWNHLKSKSVSDSHERPPSGGAGNSDEKGLKGVTANNKPMTSQTAIGTVLSKAIIAGIQPNSAVHAAALALHCLLLTEGFVCTGQDDKAVAVKGFAPPARDVPADRLVPDRWNADAGAVSFRYRRPDTPGQVFLFKTAASEGGPTSFYLKQKEKETYSADIGLAPLESSSSGHYFDKEDFFEHLFTVFRREVLSHFLPERSPPPADETLPSRDSAIDSPPSELPPFPGAPSPPPLIDEDPLREGPPRFPGPPGVGPTPFNPGRGGDFGGDIYPSGGGVGSGSNRGLPGPGGLLGPGHPMFGGGEGGGYMEPRFDPYGPPMPGQPWGSGGGGFPGRGSGTGRGGGRGSGRGPPGGPDNDHLRPPGGPDMFF